MINKDGTAWVELSDDGYIDCYSKTGINARSEGDINLYSDKNVNIEAKENINLYAGEAVNMTSTQLSADVSSASFAQSVSASKISAAEGNFNSLYSTQGEITGTFAGTLQGTAYMAMMTAIVPTPCPFPKAPNITPLKINQFTPNLIDTQVGSDKIASITTRAPTHEPFAGHDLNAFIKDK